MKCCIAHIQNMNSFPNPEPEETYLHISPKFPKCPEVCLELQNFLCAQQFEALRFLERPCSAHAALSGGLWSLD